MQEVNKTGFTLVEMLLVLLLVLVLSSLAISYGQKGIQEQEMTHFFNQLNSDVLLLQQYALKEKKKMDLEFNVNKNMYTLKYRDSQKIIYKRIMPKSMKIAAGSTLYRIGFNERGNASYVGKLTFFYFGGKKEVSVYLGTGRMEIR